MVGVTPRFALLLPVLLSPRACSYAFVHGPSASLPTSENAPEVQQAAPDCTSSNAAPIVDTVLAVPVLGAGVLLIVAGFGGNCSSGCYGPTSGEAVAIGAALTGLGVLALSSAVTGYGRTAERRRVREAVPGGPSPTTRYLLEVPALADARTREGAR